MEVEKIQWFMTSKYEFYADQVIWNLNKELTMQPHKPLKIIITILPVQGNTLSPNW